MTIATAEEYLLSQRNLSVQNVPRQPAFEFQISIIERSLALIHCLSILKLLFSRNYKVYFISMRSLFLVSCFSPLAFSSFATILSTIVFSCYVFSVFSEIR